MPLPMVVLPWGSMSMSSTRRLVAASEAARLTAVVVLPTPPFCIAMAMTRFMEESVLHPGGRALLGDERLRRRAAEAFARHLVGDRVGGAVLAAGALENLREAGRNRLDIGNDLCFARPAVVLARDADDAACVDDIVRRIQDAGRLQRGAILALRELIIGGSRHDARAQPRDRLCIEHTAEGTGREHIDIEP